MTMSPAVILLCDAAVLRKRGLDTTFRAENGGYQPSLVKMACSAAAPEFTLPYSRFKVFGNGAIGQVKNLTGLSQKCQYLFACSGDLIRDVGHCLCYIFESGSKKPFE